MNLQLALTAAMVMCPDAGLIHPRDERRSARRANRSGGEGVRKASSFPREPVNMRRLNQLLAIAREVRRHVIHDKPQNIRLLRGLIGGMQSGHLSQQQRDESEGDEVLHEALVLVLRQVLI